MSQIAVLNSKLVSLVDETYPIGLATGKMGLCIYYYHLSRWEGKDELKQLAENLLDDIVNQLSDTMDVTVEVGLAGIAIGLNHLVKEKFIGGDINEILEDVDSYIFKKLAFLDYKDTEKNIPKIEYIHLLYYLYMRYIQQNNYDDKYILQELIIRIIEMFKHDLQSDFFSEHFSFSLRNFHLPFFLYTIGKIYELNIYNARITKILKEYIDQIISIYPVSHANRLYLLCGLINIKSCLPDYQKEIDSHIQLLREGIDVEHIVNNELKNLYIYLEDGVSSVYMLLFYLQQEYSAYSIDFIPQLFFDKISKSEVWNALQSSASYFHDRNGLLNGFPGAYLVLLHIKKCFL